MRVDVLSTSLTPPRGRKLMQAVEKGALLVGHDAILTDRPRRSGALIVLYGLGGSDRSMLAGRRDVVSFDMGYWERKGDDRHCRVSIGGYHCPDLIFKGPNPGGARWSKHALPIAANVEREGPIMLVGNGPKSEAIGARGWAERKSKEIRAMFPGRKIVYRPKPKRPHEPGVVCDAVSDEPIESALAKVSLVVCRHSNVAVDACRLGVPVVCDDGAAASIYPQQLGRYLEQPDMRRRVEFLHRLAWWQWSARECADGTFWKWIAGVIGEV